MQFKGFFQFVLAVFAALAWIVSPVAAAADRPNIVVIYGEMTLAKATSAPTQRA